MLSFAMIIGLASDSDKYIAARLHPIANPLIELLSGIQILIVKSKMAAV